MKVSFDLMVSSSPDWVATVMNNFDEFLIDHANCERKASATAMSFEAKYPDRVEIIPELITTALEEMEHFQQVYSIMESRGVHLKPEMEEDLYVKQLISACRSGREDRFLDRLLTASVIECRGAERFKMIYEALEDEDLKNFYHQLWTTEAKHGNIFVEMALNYFDQDDIFHRLDFFIQKEARVLQGLTIKPVMH